MGTILRYLTGSFGSYILIAAAVAFVALGAALGVQTWRVHSLTADVATAKLDVQTYQQNAAKLEASLTTQNAAVAALEGRCTTGAAAADKAAATELARLRALHRRAISSLEHGPEAMNRFQQELAQ